ncbi:MAG: IS110 family transposase, partial [Gammaproteobacteria bacterium]
ATNDGHDAEAICEAVCRPGMRFVAINTQGQQDIQMLHRIRSRVLGERTALIPDPGVIGRMRHRVWAGAGPGTAGDRGAARG